MRPKIETFHPITNIKKRAVSIKKRPVSIKKRAVSIEKRPVSIKKRAVSIEKRPKKISDTPLIISKRDLSLRWDSSNERAVFFLVNFTSLNIAQYTNGNVKRDLEMRPI